MTRWRSKEAREISEIVARAGGTVETTAGGHLRICGPGGTAIVASAPQKGGRTLANTLATIARETGLRVIPETRKNPKTAGRKNRPARPRVARSGEVTRWVPGATAGFVTADDGRSWFVSRDELPDGLPWLPEGTRVVFSGSPTPAPGKGYPQALSVRVTDPRPAGPGSRPPVS